MDARDTEIRQLLKDASLLALDAAKAWPRHKNVARVRLAAAIARLDDASDGMEGDDNGQQAG